MNSHKTRGFAWIIILALAIPLTAWAQENDEEEEGPAPKPERMMRPSKSAPAQRTMASDRKVRSQLRSQLSTMGFRVGKMRKVGANRWSVNIVGWDPGEAQPAMRGAISWDPGEKPKGGARGKLTVVVGAGGTMTIQKQGLRAMGLRANSARMKGKMQVR